MTAASSGPLAWTTDTLGLQMAWLAKPLVEGGLAVLNFFLLRHVVYRESTSACHSEISLVAVGTKGSHA